MSIAGDVLWWHMDLDYGSPGLADLGSSSLIGDATGTGDAEASETYSPTSLSWGKRIVSGSQGASDR